MTIPPLHPHHVHASPRRGRRASWLYFAALIKGGSVSKSKLQKLFDRAVRGLRSQGFKRSMRTGSGGNKNQCAYRGTDGNRCAVGWLIPDAKYRVSLEGSTIESGDVRRAAGVEDDAALALLSDMQHAHDDSESPSAMRSALISVAANHGLDASAVRGKAVRK